MNKCEAKFKKICEMLKNEFNWAGVSYQGVEKDEAFLSSNGKLYSISIAVGVGISLSHGFDFIKSIGFIEENNNSYEDTFNLCQKIDAKCRELIN